MSIQLESKRSEAILARIDEIIHELESLKLAVWEGMQMNTDTNSTIPLVVASHLATDTSHPGSVTEQLWGALGQATIDEVNEVFSYDYEYELSQR